MKKFLIAVFILCFIRHADCQVRQDVLDYIEKYKDIAIAEMIRSKVPASITLAQGIHESSCGCSPLTKHTNNHFGIKCKSEWDGKKYYYNDDAPNECFRVYEHAEASFADHSDFLTGHPRYASLFQLKITDYKSWAYGLKSAGYATNPKYPQILIKTIEDYNLTQFDHLALAMMQGKQKAIKAEETRVEAKVTPAKPVQASRQVQAPKQVAVQRAVETEVVANNNSPRPEYVVNGMRALKAHGNEDPINIAFEYNIDYSHIIAFNDMSQGERFKNGEFIFLQGKKNKGEIERYIVVPGESMHDISQKFGIKLKELYSRNLMKPNEQVYPGEMVYLRDKAKNAPRTLSYADFLKTQRVTNTTMLTKPSNTDQNSNNKDVAAEKPVHKEARRSRYQVQESDTLYTIAKKFNMSVRQLKDLNRLPSASIYPGQKLLVSP